MMLTLIAILLTTTGVFKITDIPNDDGSKLRVEYSIPETVFDSAFLYRISGEKKVLLEKVDKREGSIVDVGLYYKNQYGYELLVYTDTVQKKYTSALVKPKASFFDSSQFPLFIVVILYTTLLLMYIQHARRGKSLYLRPIAGLQAVDEAVGRATEMGRPILYVPGLSSISDVATIAALNILSHVTKKAGEYETKILVPVRDPVVYTIAREIVKESYYSIGRPDLYSEDDVFFATDSQFGYAAHVSGTMVRERTATNFFLGMFWAESLILSETGASTGAIQIAGTDAVTQLPFFIVTCDYTLMGEELYAASAYLSHEPMLTATLKGQDAMKVIILGIIGALSILNLFGIRLTLGLF